MVNFAIILADADKKGFKIGGKKTVKRDSHFQGFVYIVMKLGGERPRELGPAPTAGSSPRRSRLVAVLL